MIDRFSDKTKGFYLQKTIMGAFLKKCFGVMIIVSLVVSCVPLQAYAIEPAVLFMCYKKVLDLTQDEFFDANTISGFYFSNQEYTLYDVDDNGVVELLVKAGTCEADYVWRIYTVANNKEKKIAEIDGGHSLLGPCDTFGFYLHWGHMGDSQTVKYTYMYGALIEDGIYDEIEDVNFLRTVYIEDYTLLEEAVGLTLYGIINQDNVNIGAQPDFNRDNAVGRLMSGDQVALIGKTDKWYHIVATNKYVGYESTNANIKGYVLSNYVDIFQLR